MQCKRAANTAIYKNLFAMNCNIWLEGLMWCNKSSVQQCSMSLSERVYQFLQFEFVSLLFLVVVLVITWCAAPGTPIGINAGPFPLGFARRIVSSSSIILLVLFYVVYCNEWMKKCENVSQYSSRTSFCSRSIAHKPTALKFVRITSNHHRSTRTRTVLHPSWLSLNTSWSKLL